MQTPTALQSDALKKLVVSLVFLAVLSHSSKFLAWVTTSSAAKAKSSTDQKAAGASAGKPVVDKAPGKTASKKPATRSRKARRRVVRGQRTIEAARVVEIQNALAAAGYYKLEPNGEWDDSTSKAMSAYQQDNGFKTTGKPDALSLKKLGL